MTRFDAEIPPSTGARFTAVIRTRPATFVVSIVVAVLSIAVSAAVMLAAQMAHQQLDRLTGSLQLAVYLAPTVTRADAEAMRSRIEVASVVAGATLRSREAAMSDLVEHDKLPSLAAKPNPLPDVWLVTLRLPAAGTLGNVAAEVEAARRALAALPGVDSVKFDPRWVDWVDRWSPAIAHGLDAIGWLVIGGLAVLIGGSFFLAGAAYGEHRTSAGMLAVVGLIGVVIAWAVVALIALMAAQAASPDLRLVVTNGMNEWRGGGLLLLGTSLVAALIGSTVAARKR